MCVTFFLFDHILKHTLGKKKRSNHRSTMMCNVKNEITINSIDKSGDSILKPTELFLQVRERRAMR